MRTVWGLGETLLDIVFKENIPIGANPGGSVLNALVSLSRLKCKTSFISEIGDDQVGQLILNFLKSNKIDISHLYIHSDGATTLSMAFLNERNDATYQFYKNQPKERFVTTLPPMQEDDIFLFGSSLSINQTVRARITPIINKAIHSNTIIVYDPNCRQNHTNNPEVLSLIKENFKSSTIVRCSNEDLIAIFGLIPLTEAIKKAQEWCKNIIITQNSASVIAYFGDSFHKMDVEEIEVVNTIGAGDNFNAGIIYSIQNQNITKKTISKLNQMQIMEILKCGIAFSKEVCLSTDNYIAIK